MLGFAPLAANPLASVLSALVAVSGPMDATGGLTFSGSAAWGSFSAATATGGLTFGGSPTLGKGLSISATGGLRFGGSPAWSATWDIPATGGLTFSAHAILRAAGRPIIISAAHDNFAFRVVPDPFDFTALTQGFVFRGIPE